MSIDARVRYTKMIIRETFFSLIEEKPVTKITVKELCEKADINRAMFYRYYQDVYDLLNQMEDEFIEQMKSESEYALDNDLIKFLKGLLEMLKTKTAFYYMFVKSDAGEHFAKKLMDAYYPDARRRMADMYPNVSEQGIKWCYSYITGGTASMIDTWMRNGMAESTDEIASFIAKLFNATTYGIKAIAKSL